MIMLLLLATIIPEQLLDSQCIRLSLVKDSLLTMSLCVFAAQQNLPVEDQNNGGKLLRVTCTGFQPWL